MREGQWYPVGWWDDICDRCGRCCFEREVDEDGDVVVDYAAPCEFLNTETRLCTVYEDRFRACDRCGQVSIFTALFDPRLPEGCAYARTFRKWRKESEL